MSIPAVTLCPVLFAVPKNITVCLPCLLNSTISNWYCIALNERISVEYWIEKNVQGSCHNLIEVTVMAFAGRG